MRHLIFDFRCATCDTVEEAFVTPATTEIQCNKCGKSAKKILSPVTSKIDGTDPSFPGAYMKWGRMRNKRNKKRRDY